MVFQDPMTSLNPAFTIGTQLVDTIRLHRTMSKRAARRARRSSCSSWSASPTPSAGSSDYPHQLSGGMRQRALLAVALSCEPRLLIADEPTTALDVTVQAQILDLLRSLQERLGMAVDLRDPRPRRRRRPLLARDRDVRGPGGRGGAGRGAVRAARATRTPRGCSPRSHKRGVGGRAPGVDPRCGARGRPPCPPGAGSTRAAPTRSTSATTDPVELADGGRRPPRPLHPRRRARARGRR